MRAWYVVNYYDRTPDHAEGWQVRSFNTEREAVEFVRDHVATSPHRVNLRLEFRVELDYAALVGKYPPEPVAHAR